MSRILQMFAWFLLLISCTFSWAQSPESLKVISWNIKGLPGFFLKSEYKEERYKIIGELLEEKDPGIVALQEAFTEETNTLIKESGLPYKSLGPKKNSFLGVSSGLYILSRWPIVEEQSAEFSHCLSFDCFSNKGVQLARIALPGFRQTLEVYNTHMQAGRNDSKARQEQTKVLVNFFQKHHKVGSPVLFIGDFNFRPGMGQESFKIFSDATEFGHAGKYCLENACAKSKDDGWHGLWERAVDHQFYSLDGVFTPREVIRNYREPYLGYKLSDHPSLEVLYKLNKKATKP